MKRCPRTSEQRLDSVATRVERCRTVNAHGWQSPRASRPQSRVFAHSTLLLGAISAKRSVPVTSVAMLLPRRGVGIF